MAHTPFSVRIDDQVRIRLKQEAKQRNRSESFIAAEAIESYLDSSEQKRAAIDAAVRQAEHGSFISSDSINEWVQSWGSDKEIPLPKSDTQL